MEPTHCPSWARGCLASPVALQQSSRLVRACMSGSALPKPWEEAPLLVTGQASCEMPHKLARPAGGGAVHVWAACAQAQLQSVCLRHASHTPDSPEAVVSPAAPQLSLRKR